METLALIAQAIDSGNIPQAVPLLKAYLKEVPEDPWGQFYVARIHEHAGRLRNAEDTYRQVLKKTTQVKLINLARQGIERVQAQEKNQRQEAIATALADPEQTTPGCLILDPMDNAHRNQVVPEFARFMQLDAYTARLHLPTRIWRVYRTGSLGELNVYQQSLQKIGIPCFCLGLKAIASISVFWIEQIQFSGDQLMLTGRDLAHPTDAPQSLAIPLTEIQAWIEGLVPIFEQVVDQGNWRKLIRKEKTQDYAHLIDLHHPPRQQILRICSHTYNFHPPGTPLPGKGHQTQTTHRQHWNALITQLSDRFSDRLPQSAYRQSHFNHFAEAAFDQDLFLDRIHPYIELMRLEPTPWDSAFHLYSLIHWFHPKPEAPR